MSAPLVEVEGLSRRFDEVWAVSEVTFQMRRGQVLGFIGANGSGKTTTMRIMATLDAPTSGRVLIDGHDVSERAERVRPRIGWMPDAYGHYPHTTAQEYLDFFARAYGFAGQDRNRRVEEIIEFADLGELRDRPMKGLSKGMAQRLCLGRALLNDPDLMLLDEPAAGLDPRARIEFKRLVRLLAAEGKTLFISSHILSELEEMCDALLFIDHGRIVHHGSAESLKRAGVGAVVTVRVQGDPAGLQTWALESPGVAGCEALPDGARFTFTSGDEAFLAERLRALVGAGFAVHEFRREQRRLEEAFVEILQGLPGNGA